MLCALLVPGLVLAAGVITPATYSDDLQAGEVVVVPATVEIDSGAPAVSLVDVFFLTDNTGSMNDFIDAVKDNVDIILDTISGATSDPRFTGIDVAFGVGNYVGDPGVEGTAVTTAYELQQPITTDLAATKAAVNAWTASGGGDYPEANFFALHQVATEGAATDGLGATDPPAGFATLSLTGWRAGAGRVIVWAGDAPSHTTTVSILEAKLALQAADVVVCALNTKGVNQGIDASSQAQGIVDATGGTLEHNVSGTAATIDAILDAVATVTETIDLSFTTIPDPVPGLPVSIACTDPAGCDDVPAGESRTFAWTITGNTSGHYEFDIVATGVSGAVAEIVIDVAANCGNEITEPGEQCDDGAQVNGDGCSADCLLEECWNCTGSPSACAHDDGFPCDDRQECTSSDQCLGGICQGTPTADGTACDDGPACTLANFCTAGECTGTLGTVIAERRAKLAQAAVSSVGITVLSDTGSFRAGRDSIMEDGTLLSVFKARLARNTTVDDISVQVLIKSKKGVNIEGSQSAWLSPGIEITDVCTEPVFACDKSKDVFAEQGASLALTPGQYGDLHLGLSVVLEMEAGEYDFCSIRTKTASEIIIMGTADTVIRVEGKVVTGPDSVFAPVGASVPVLQSGGSVKLGRNSENLVHIEAPESRVLIGMSAQLNGTVCAKKVDTKKFTELGCDLPVSSAAGSFVDGPIIF
ncbi:MAG: hypothetical protein VCC00_08740 [Deltaproteobacteria bacterium]